MSLKEKTAGCSYQGPKSVNQISFGSSSKHLFKLASTKEKLTYFIELKARKYKQLS